MHFTRQSGRNPVTFAMFAWIVKVLDPKKFFDKTIAAQVHGSNIVIFDFLENVIFF